MSTALYNPQPDGFLALDWSQVIPYGFIPVIQTRTPNASEQPVNQVTISVDSAASVRITAADDASVSRLFDGFRLELQTVNEDLPDTLVGHVPTSFCFRSAWVLGRVPEASLAKTQTLFS